MQSRYDKVKAYEFPEKEFTEKRNVSMSWMISVDINLKYINVDISALAVFQHCLFQEIAEVISDQKGRIQYIDRPVWRL